MARHVKGVPSGWIVEADIVATTGVGNRTLLNWRHWNLLPENVWAICHLGAPGTVVAYHPIALRMVERIKVFRGERNRIDICLLRLRFEGYPVDIVEWCRDCLTPLAVATSRLNGRERKKAEDYAAGKPEKRSDPRRSVYNRLRHSPPEWGALMRWTVGIAFGSSLEHSVFDPGSMVLAAFDKALDLSALAGPVPVQKLLPSGEFSLEKWSLSHLLAVLDDHSEAELEQALADMNGMFAALSRPVIRPDDVGAAIRRRVLATILRRRIGRAFLLPALILLRRSPDHREKLDRATQPAAMPQPDAR